MTAENKSEFIWLMIPCYLALLYIWTYNFYPLDYWLHLNNGRQILALGEITYTDDFTYTIAGQRLGNQAWLSGLIMYALSMAGGYKLVQFVIGILYAGAIGLVISMAWKRSNSNHAAAGLAIIGFGVMISNMGIRPQAFSALLFAITLFTLFRFPERWFSVAILFGVELLWTNLHGAFPLGVVLPGLFAAATLWEGVSRPGYREFILKDKRLHVYTAALAATALAMFLNPDITDTIQYVTGVSSRASERGIVEWLPTSWNSVTGKIFFSSSLLAIAVICFSKKRLEKIDILLLTSFFILAVQAQRFVMWWGLMLPLCLSRQVAQLFSSIFKNRDTGIEKTTRADYFFVILFFLFLFMSTPWTRTWNPILPGMKRQAAQVGEPFEVKNFLKKSGCRGRVFASMEWGSYLSWFLYPDIKVFVDSRIDYYPDTVWDDYIKIGNASPETEKLLNDYEADFVVWNHRDGQDLPGLLSRSENWTEVYSDEKCVLFIRSTLSSPKNKYPEQGITYEQTRN